MPRKDKEKVREYDSRYWQDYNERERSKRLKHSYGITLEVYNTLLDGQHFVCSICHAPDFDNGCPLHVDHDHQTGWVRGLLCKTCNQGLGVFSDDIERLQRAIEYLRFHNREGQLPINQQPTRNPEPCPNKNPASPSTT